MRADNPAKGVAGNKERGRRRYLKDPELERLLGIELGASGEADAPAR